MAALLFDFGGTLIDQDVFLDAARNAAIDRIRELRHGGPIDEETRRAFSAVSSQVWREHQGLPPSVKEKLIKRETISRYMTRLELPTEDAVIDDVYAKYVEAAVESNCVFPGVADMLQALSGSFAMAIVSNGLADYTWQFFRRHDLIKYFRVRLISEETDTEKPDPGIFRQAMEALGESPDETVMIGNMLYEDVLGARNAGIRSVWLDRREKQRVNDVTADFRITEIGHLPSVLRRAFPGVRAAG